jgi:hypothetical protein
VDYVPHFIKTEDGNQEMIGNYPQYFIHAGLILKSIRLIVDNSRTVYNIWWCFEISAYVNQYAANDEKRKLTSLSSSLIIRNVYKAAMTEAISVRYSPQRAGMVKAGGSAAGEPPPEPAAASRAGSARYSAQKRPVEPGNWVVPRVFVPRGRGLFAFEVMRKGAMIDEPVDRRRVAKPVSGVF